MTARTLGIISIKGGVGKTTTASNIAASLASDFKKKVLLVDANFSAPNLGFHLGEVNPSNTIHDVLTDKINITKSVKKHDAGFDYIVGSLMKSHLYPFKLKKKLMKIRDNYDFIILDSSPTINNEILATIFASDSLFCITTPDFPTLSCTMHAVKLAKNKNTAIAGLILTKTRGKMFELGVEDIESSTNTPVMAVIPDDIKVVEALSKTMPCTMAFPRADASIEYKKLAAAMIGADYKDPRLGKRIKGVFNRGVRKDDVNRMLLTKGFFEV